MEVNLLNGSELNRMLLRCDTAAGTCVSHDIPMVGAHTVRMGEVHALKHLWAAMRSGHLSVLEHCTLTFAIEGISRACSHQLVRHRLMSVEQQSQRNVGMNGFSYVEPESITRMDSDKRVWSDGHEDWVTPHKAFGTIMEMLSNAYEAMVEAGVPEEDARYILPNACCTNLVVTMNLREFIHFCGLRRCCYDDETEILTNEGWKKFTELNGNELFYSLNPESWDCELVPAKAVYHYDYIGDMIRIKAQSVDLLVTPNHKLYCNPYFEQKHSKNKWVLREAEEVTQWNRCLFKKNCNPIQGKLENVFTFPQIRVTRRNQHKEWDVYLTGPTIPTKEWFKFLAFYLSDGCVHKSGQHRIITLSKGDKAILEKYIPIIAKLTKNKIRMQFDDHCYKIIFEDEYMYEYLKQFGKAPQKRLPQYVWDYDSSILLSLVEGFTDGDCNRYTGALSTTSRGMADDFQRLMLHIGCSSTITMVDRRNEMRLIKSRGKLHNIQSRHVEYVASRNNSKNMPLIKTNKRDPFSMVDYTGTIHCVELEQNHIVYVRRHGYACWSGNSRAQWEIRELADRMAEEVSEHVPWLAPWLGPQCDLLGYCPEQRSCGRVPKRGAVVDAIPDEMDVCPQLRLFPTTNGGLEWYD